MTKTAIKPTHFADIRNIRSLKNKEKIKEKGLDPEEATLHALADTEGWKTLEKFIKEVSADLNDLTRTQMENGATTEQIGATAVTVELCKELLGKILNRVTDASEAVEKEITKGPKGRGQQ